jgi:hypothetical protein
MVQVRGSKAGIGRVDLDAVSLNSAASCTVTMFTAAFEALYPRNLYCANSEAGSLLSVSEPSALDTLTMRAEGDLRRRTDRLA